MLSLGALWAFSAVAEASTCSANFVTDLRCDGTVIDDRVYAWDADSRVNDDYNSCRPSPGLHLQEGGERIYRFTCPYTGPVQIEMDDEDCDLDLFVVRQACGLPNDCHDYDTRGFGSTSVAQISCVVGARYWIAVESYAPWYDGPAACPTVNGGARVSGPTLGWSTYSDFELRAVCDEICDDGLDNDGDGDEDCDDADCPCAEECGVLGDEDGDGLSDCADPDCLGDPVCCDADDDGYIANTAICGNGTDCNDSDSNIRPGGYDAPADGIDGNCNGVDTCYQDLDRDTYGSTVRINGGSLTCGSHPGDSANALDCADTGANAASIYPNAPEVAADGIDQDCNGVDACYVDADDDGFGTSALTGAISGACTALGLSPVSGDCLDTGPGAVNVNPVATETCNSRDDDCDGLTDDADNSRVGGTTWYADLDGDGFAGAVSTVLACSAPPGASATSPDCLDSGPGAVNVYPTATEVVADGIDQNCDAVDICWTDADGDGFGGLLTRLSTDLSCAHAGMSEVSGDCRDTGTGAAGVNPDALEVCNTFDDDCDLLVDDADLSLSGATVWYLDLDGDGYAGSTTASACVRPSNGFASATDCRDQGAGAATVNPGAIEVPADGLDQDCDGVDHCFPDLDGDGYGAGAAVAGVDMVCGGGDGTSAVNTDCRDTGVGAGSVSPAAQEVCNGFDDDCDLLVDDADVAVGGRLTWYADLDQDGFGGTRSVTQACVVPAGHTAAAEDCNDAAAGISPVADEVCDGIDNDCDAAIDDADASLVDRLTSWLDGDGDGFGDPLTSQSTATCSLPEGWVDDATDCDDLDLASFPGADEVPYDAIDQDCDGFDLDDVDGDGVAGGPLGADCADEIDWIHPGAVEQADGVDEDCDGVVDEGTERFDDDGDGLTELGGDCDDTRVLVGPAAIESCNSRDDDCDGTIDEDTSCFDDDGDGMTEDDGDCHDGDARTFLGATEPDGGGIDRNCDGFVSGHDADRDGYTVAGGDCNDRDASVRPGLIEVADGVDQDCNGRVDDRTLVYDDDLDGVSESGGDCDDNNPLVHPSAAERIDNGRDDDCDGLVDEGGRFHDDDGDGYTEDAGDCNDTNPAVFPYAQESANTVDDDCDGEIDQGVNDLDGDGWTVAEGDCDDGQGWARPDASEICDGIDNDCNGLTDEGCRDRDPIDPPPTEGRSCSTGGVGGGWGWLSLLGLGLVRRRGRLRLAA
jgi:hypothetical protein